MSTRNSFILFYHLLFSLLNFYMLYWNCVSDEKLYFLQNFCYLTILTNTFICLYSLMVLDYDFRYIRKEGKEIDTRYPSHIHTLFQLIHGLGAVVIIAYWGLRLFKPDFLFPEGRVLVPELLTTYSHGGNFIVLAMELGLYKQKIFLNETGKLKMFCGVIGIYMSIQTAHRRFYGYHIYPFIEKMDYTELFSFYGVLFMICIIWDWCFCKMFIRKK